MYLLNVAFSFFTPHIFIFRNVLKEKEFLHIIFETEFIMLCMTLWKVLVLKHLSSSLLHYSYALSRKETVNFLGLNVNMDSHCP